MTQKTNITPFSKIEACEGINTIGIQEDGTVDGYFLETHYLPAEDLKDYGDFLGIQIDDDSGTMIETRVPWKVLKQMIAQQNELEGKDA